MTSDNPVILNNPTPPTNPNNDVEKEIIVKDNFGKDLVKNFKHPGVDIVLPDDVPLKDEGSKTKTKQYPLD